MGWNKLLAGKIALITSGALGIGKEIAMCFAKQGALVIIADINEDALEKTYSELKKISCDSRSFKCDMGNKQEVDSMCKAVINQFGSVDILVNSVGVKKQNPVHLIDEKDFQDMIDINLKSMVRCMKAFVPKMIEKRAGSIVNISSIHAVSTMPNYGAYAATKGAINAIARVAALDYAPYGIRVNTICPGLIMSDAVKTEIAEYKDEKEKREFINLLNNMQPLPPGRVEDIAYAALYLASDLSKYVTGITLMVDGGASIQAHPTHPNIGR
jgi:NAD(P)-dependent dehydrogenase (short-subunit alcohol dehydrogenase family)